jgi:hypothetical protein
MESASSLPALFDTPAESFATLAQAQTKAGEPAAKTTAGTKAQEPAAKTTSFFESASATQIGAIALGVVAVAAAASSGGGSGDGSSDGGSTPPKVVAAPIVAAGNDGAITVTLAGDAATAKLFLDGKEITENFKQPVVTAATATTPAKLTFEPLAGKVEYNGKITAKAADSKGVSSADSLSVSYTFDNIAPSPPTVTAAAETGVITVTLATTSDAATTKLSADGQDVTSKFTRGGTGLTATFTPMKGAVDLDNASVTATAADAAKNVSAASTAVTYSFDNVPPVAPTIAAGAKPGSISVTSTADVAAFGIFAGSTDIGSKFTIEEQSGTVDLLVPNPLSFDGKSQSITVVALDKAGNASAASGTLTYTFDNTPPAAAPTALQADSKSGVITMDVGADATSAKLFAGTADITPNFSSKATGTTLTFTPLAGKVEYAAQAIDVKASDEAGNLSTASTKLAAYAFDNVAPPAPNSIVLNATNGNVTVSIGSIGQPVASTVKLFLGTTDITNKYVADTTVAGTVTFVPVPGQILPSNQTLTATVADAAGNVSVESSPSAPTPALNLINITAESASKALSGFPASGADVLFTVDTSVSYSAKVTEFRGGDKLVFKGDPSSTFNFKNTDTSDDRLTFTAIVGDKAVVLTLTDLPSGADLGIFGQKDFNKFFGTDSLSFATGATAEPKTTQAIDVNNFAGSAGAGFDAAGSGVAYTVNDGAFASTIANFAIGDSIAFVGNGAAPTLNYENKSSSDGLVIIKGSFASGNVAQLTLKGLATTDVEQIFGTSDFEAAFGPGSLTVVGQAGANAVDVTAIDNGGPGGFNASTGNFSFNIGVGDYKTTINGFGQGDSLSFFGAKDATFSFKNNSETDGVVLVTGVVDGKAVEVTVGVGTDFDNKLYGFKDFNDTFGSGTLIA